LLLVWVWPYHRIDRLTSRCSEWLAGTIPSFNMNFKPTPAAMLALASHTLN
jgi:hypothetical protein